MVFAPITVTIDSLTLGLAYLWDKWSKWSRNGNIQENAVDQKDIRKKGTVTVVLTTHKQQKTVRRSLQEIYQQDYPIKNIYVSDSNLDGTKDVVEHLMKNTWHNLNYWSKPNVKSKAEKINSLIQDPEVELGDYVYFIDSEVSLHPGAVRYLADRLSEDSVAAVTSYGYVTLPENYSATFFHYGKEWVNRLGKFRKVAQGYRRAVTVVCGASFMVKSSVIKEIGMPLQTMTEDTAFTWRLQKSGYKVVLVPESVVSSRDVSSLKAQLKQSYRWYVGTWQTFYLNTDIFSPKSRAKSLAYTTVLPGLIESLGYTLAVISLPALAFFWPGLAKAFLIGDTTLSFLAPLAAPMLSGDVENIFPEIIYTIKRYPQITIYKILSSALWLLSCARVSYDVVRGRTKEWKNGW